MHFCPKAVKTKNDNFITEEHEPASLLDLGTSYYMKEHTKPLFHKHKILAFKNLYNY